MKLKLRHLWRIVWLIACLAVLVWTFVVCGHETNATLRGECSLLGAVIMAFLTLPLGLLWWLLVSAAEYGLSLVGIDLGSVSAIVDWFVWFGFLAVGYLQWFSLVPWAVRRIRVRRQRTAQEEQEPGG